MITHLGIIGCGHLSHFVCEGLARSNWQGKLHVSPYNRTKAEMFSELFGAKISKNNQSVIDDCDAVLVATRPSQVTNALNGLLWPENRILISAMAGVKCAQLRDLAPNTTVIRCMPISAASIARSPTPLFPNHPDVTTLLRHIGTIIPFTTETTFETASANAAVYGWYFALVDTMITANKAAGLDPESARTMTVETLAAVTNILQSSNETAGELLSKLATPHGITEHGLTVLNDHGANSTWQAAFQSVVDRIKSQ